MVGGRLRLAHEQNENLSLQTRLVSWDGQYAVFRCTAVTQKGEYAGYGTANAQRDARLADSLIELAETRSIARALRFAGYGLEYTGAEEVAHVAGAEPERDVTVTKATKMANLVAMGAANPRQTRTVAAVTGRYHSTGESAARLDKKSAIRTRRPGKTALTAQCVPIRRPHP